MAVGADIPTLVGRFDQVSLADLSRGTVQGEKPFAAATMNRFRPDRKAAALLHGADVLFGSLMDTFDQVIRSIGRRDDLLADEVRLAIWAILVHEAYRCQPALFAAAATARSVQQATDRWRPRIPDGMAMAPVERDPQDSGDLIRPLTLGILDDAISDLADVRFPDKGEGASQGDLRADAIDRWLRHILESEDRGLAWLVDVRSGHGVEVFTGFLGSLNGFLDESIPPRPGEAHEPATLLPRIPGSEELLRMDERSRRTTIWVVSEVHRLLRDNRRFGDSERLQLAVTREAGVLAELAEKVLAPRDPLVPVTKARHANKVAVDERDADWSKALDALATLRRSIDQVVELWREGSVDSGSIADFVRSFSAIINSIAGDAAHRGDPATARRIHEEVLGDWEVFFSAIGIRPEDLLRTTLASRGGPTPDDESSLLATHLHNYAAALLHDPDPETRQRAIEIEQHIVIPARRRVSRYRQTSVTLTVALQVLLRALAAQLDGRTGADASHLDQLLAAGGELVQHSKDLVEAAMTSSPGEHRLRSGQINTLTALVAAGVVAAEHGTEIAGLPLDSLRRIGERADEELAERAKGGHSGRLNQLRGYRVRLDALVGVGAPPGPADSLPARA